MCLLLSTFDSTMWRLILLDRRQCIHYRRMFSENFFIRLFTDTPCPFLLSQICLFLKQDYSLYFMLYVRHVHEWYSLKPEEGIRFPETGVTDG